jgi:hypothetical protein
MSNEDKYKESKIPNSPNELLAMQPGKLEKEMTPKVKKILEFIDKLEPDAAEDIHIALILIARLEYFHSYMTKTLIEEGESKPEEVCGWAVDADRLWQCRQILESVEDFDVIDDV